MRAFSMWQPHATAAAIGSKGVETRGWSTSIRGPVAIHAAKRCVRSEMEEYLIEPQWAAALNIAPRLDVDGFVASLPFGAIIAVAELVWCVRSEDFDPFLIDHAHHRQIGDAILSWSERDMGDFSPGRFGWVLADVVRLEKPIPYNGLQGFFNVPNSLFEELSVEGVCDECSMTWGGIGRFLNLPGWKSPVLCRIDNEDHIPCPHCKGMLRMLRMIPEPAEILSMHRAS